MIRQVLRDRSTWVMAIFIGLLVTLDMLVTNHFDASVVYWSWFLFLVYTASALVTITVLRAWIRSRR